MKNIGKLGLGLGALVVSSCSGSLESKTIKDNISKVSELAQNIQDAKEMGFNTQQCAKVLDGTDGSFRTIRADYNNETDNLQIYSNAYMLYGSEGDKEAHLQEYDGYPISMDPLQASFIDKDISLSNDGKLDWIKRKDGKFTNIEPHAHRFDPEFYNQALNRLLTIDYASGRCDTEKNVVEDMEDNSFRKNTLWRIAKLDESN